jgi:hypothetical protein
MDAQNSDVIFQNCLSEAFARECAHDTIWPAHLVGHTDFRKSVILISSQLCIFQERLYLGAEGGTNRHLWKIEFPILTNSGCFTNAIYPFFLTDTQSLLQN